MLHILLVTPRLDSWHGFADALSSDPGVRLDHAASGAAALEEVGWAAPQLAIIDAGLPDISPPGPGPEAAHGQRPDQHCGGERS